MKIILTKQESEKFFYYSLCNGLSYVSGYGIEISWPGASYNNAKKRLEKRNKAKKDTSVICYEDILMEILRGGGSIKVEDTEGGQYNRTITLKNVHDRVKKTPPQHLIDMINENDDAVTADVILQTVFFNEVIFG